MANTSISFCGATAEDQLEFARLHDRQVGGLGALEHATDIDAAPFRPNVTVR
jgi:hypothetical protein